MAKQGKVSEGVLADESDSPAALLKGLLARHEGERAAQFVSRMAIVALVVTHPEPRKVIGVLQYLADCPEEAANGNLTETELILARDEARDLANQLLVEIAHRVDH